MSNLNLKYKTVGGLVVPREMPDHQAYNTIFRFGWSPRYWKRVLGERGTAPDLDLMHPSDAIIHWVRALLDPHDFEIQSWSERMLMAFADENAEVCNIGPASSGKSEALGLYLLGMWGIAPMTTTCLLVSTTVPQLRRRSFGACAKFHAKLKKIGYPGVYSRQFTMICQEDELRDGISSTDIKSGIIGIAADGGKGPEDAASGMGGIHQSTTAGASNEGEGAVIVCIDEAQAIPEAIYKASVNLQSGSDYFKMHSLGNIFFTSGNSLADRAEPKGGWASIDMHTDRWENVRNNSITIRFDGTRSPAVIEEGGEDRYPYLIGPSHIANMLNGVKGNASDPYYLSMVRAWPSDADSTSVVLSAAAQSKGRCREEVVWASGAPQAKFLGIDPAWSAGGDNAVAQEIHTGMMADGLYGIFILPPVYLKIDPSSKMPIQYQLSTQIEDIMIKSGIPLKHVGSDETASQLLMDVMIMETGQQDPVRVGFSSRATDRQVSVFSEQKANQRYANLVTELWFQVEQFASYGHIRGLVGEAARQFATRQIIPDKRPIRLEKKSDFKSRLRSGSPDEADALAVAVHVMALRTGCLPGTSVHNPHGAAATLRKSGPSCITTDYDDSNYSEVETCA